MNLKQGFFKMVIHSKFDTLIVLLVMDNFVNLNSETIYRCEIKKPFRLIEVINDFSSKQQLNKFLMGKSTCNGLEI